MEFKGTKGKWYYDKEKSKVRKEDGNTLCVCYYSNIINKEECEPNALLISKAPEMLEMLKELCNVILCYEQQTASISNNKLKAEQLIKEATEI